MPDDLKMRNRIEFLQKHLANIHVIGVHKGPRNHTHLNEPQAMNWALLAWELSAGWRISHDILERLGPQNPLYRQERGMPPLPRALSWEDADDGDDIPIAFAPMPDRPPVWYAIPVAAIEAARPCLFSWRAAGYRVAILVDHNSGRVRATDADLIVWADDYKGYPVSCNLLDLALVGMGAMICINGGSDIYPDPVAKPADVAEEFLEHFDGFCGVMQPIGDRFEGTDRICGSPWIGRDFIERANGGWGPWCPDYFHYFCDEELFNVAQAAGLLWQRDDLTQHHDHWTRKRAKQPVYLKRAQNNWDEAKALHAKRKKAGYPGAWNEDHRGRR